MDAVEEIIYIIYNIKRPNTCDLALKLLNEEITSDIHTHKQNLWKEHLDAYCDHRHNIHTLEDHTRSVQQSTYTHFQHIHNIQQHSNILRIISPNNSQTLPNTQHTRQTDPLTEQHRTYKDITLHSPQFRSKRQYKIKLTTHMFLAY